MLNTQTNTDPPSTTEKKEPEETPAPRKRGFGSMSPEQVRELARRGGKAAHRSGKAHEFTSEEARSAGQKGGIATSAARKKKAE